MTDNPRPTPETDALFARQFLQRGLWKSQACMELLHDHLHEMARHACDMEAQRNSNTRMLARQCDLAREAETRADQARDVLRRILRDEDKDGVRARFDDARAVLGERRA